ncbi:MAG: type II toxin-antitoxin system antitoxin, RelB/DinJ family, partial [Streptococcus parasanguinis]|nr:type II toxin-antitoxin system antitoxin, RelB/DinJ family [Streptococcus parasanguinis]
LPFDVRLDDRGKLLQVVTDVEQNRNMSQPFESVSDLMEDLRA